MEWEGKILFGELAEMCTDALSYTEDMLVKAIGDAKKREGKGLAALLAFPEKKGTVRQDLLIEEKCHKNLVSYPLIVKPSEKDLRKLDLSEFYDSTCYLGALSIVARKIDDKFHEAVQEMFGIDEATKTSKSRKIIHFKRGPIKLYERSKAKTQNDYGAERFPTSAKVGDMVRCSLVFEDCMDCVEAVEHLINSAKSKKSCIVEIARIKNM